MMYESWLPLHVKISNERRKWVRCYAVKGSLVAGPLIHPWCRSECVRFWGPYYPHVSSHVMSQEVRRLINTMPAVGY